jgi:IclR family transcriptional regulator, acetate operon repressor
MATPSLLSLEKAVGLLRRIVQDKEEYSISELAAKIGVPRSTAFRIIATFERTGLITRLCRGRYLPGPTLLRLVSPGSLNRVLTGLGRPIIQKLARKTRCTAHLGVFEGGMVTYLVKSDAAKGALFTREGTQLEAYCTGIGKVLLASLPESALGEYLASGPFIRMTPNTLTASRALKRALATVKVKGYATDNAEMDVDLKCLAVPVHDGDGTVVAALSIALRNARGDADDLLVHLGALRAASHALTQRLLG